MKCIKDGTYQGHFKDGICTIGFRMRLRTLVLREIFERKKSTSD